MHLSLVFHLLMTSEQEINSKAHTGFEKDGVVYLWYTERLWELTKTLSVFEFEVSSFNGFDKNVWFGPNQEPTVNKVLEHMKKIENADLNFPIILSQENIVLDGVHRICRAHLEGRKKIPAVRFEIDPEPDFTRQIK
ncbi:MAG: hypothetical protein K9K67_11725 [Bacteriovoracaceae bacterium]|nr:hypothetical protein [Bacteriovoracaceae bacterium]